MIGSAGRLTRDWRIKTLVPAVLVNVLAFAGLYALMVHFAISNLIQTYKSNAAVLFDELQLHFDDETIAHPASILNRRLERHAATHGLSTLVIYGFDERSDAQPLFITGRAPSTLERAEAQRARHASGSGVLWAIGADNQLILDRSLASNAHCERCHASGPGGFGVMQMGFDLTRPIADAGVRVRQKFAVAGVAWLGVLALLFWTGRSVIGRPLSEIARSLAGGHDGAEAQPQDLNEMANRLNATLWDLVHAQRRREAEVARMMVRAEQMAALGEVAAGLTHEIKNPLAGIMAVLELLQTDQELAAQHRELFEQMLAELRRVTSTVDSLLRLAKPQPPRRAAFDLPRAVREVTSLFAARLRRQGVSLDVQMSDSIPLLELDQTLITQLLVNLLTNSLQATDRGGNVKVLLAPFPDQRGIVLAVQDTGRGIPPEEVEHVFDPFFTTKEEGTGLGLAICRQIVEQHGGTISLESELGSGTRVVVLLPESLEANAQKDEDTDAAAAFG